MSINAIINEDNIKDFFIIFFITIFTLKFNYRILDIKEKHKNLPIYFLALIAIDILAITIRNKIG